MLELPLHQLSFIVSIIINIHRHFFMVPVCLPLLLQYLQALAKESVLCSKD